ncbi:MAG: hypothetical protein HOK52_02775 [Candidatus Marinimicrobia bacterium]|jgi:UDP-N-acetylglucosamine diphosphorylase/glucosamine-1-phosphate N-acetyltransferase|nr:hypothetical protein [Candidatus Neomarinimicrobiota bacterium]MBT3936567.1 hypothetical protein [Candidatus Neomarinimicrobiota bacterium]MBT4382779.1 hypothetical protein [Candidatus Neomarinimicrobiota bacterium]MBT4684711.1 hypothetical protein [Candidatus Neomarinimicrobiota bacterium]MBT4733502.1 hypothetical protein [Candidatus Neomarinimicrobiota bacterium]
MIYIFEDQFTLDLEPIVFTRPSFGIRSGPETFYEQLIQLIDGPVSGIVRKDIELIVQNNYPTMSVNPSSFGDGIWLLGCTYWTSETIQLIHDSPNTVFKSKGRTVGANITGFQAKEWIEKGGPLNNDIQGLNEKNINVYSVRFLWDIIRHIPKSISSAIDTISIGSTENDDTYIHPTSIIHDQVILNSKLGPIIIDENVEIHPFTLLEGPLYLGKGTIVKPHSHIKESIFGPQCKLGGEIHSCIFQSYSNKVHDGHLGDSFIGEWVNLGAGTTNSNLKNDYSNVVIDVNGAKRDSGGLFLGSLIGDHTKTAIGTQLNTGTVIGTGCNILAHSFPMKNIKPFTFYLNGKKRKMNWDSFIESTSIVKSRRNQFLTPVEMDVLERIYNKQ